MADLDGDGHMDLVTGSFDGGAHWVRRLPEGGYARPQKVLNENGAVLRVGQYWQNATDGRKASWQRSHLPHGIAAAPLDLDEDGRADLLLGTSCGRIYAARNLGGEGGPRFSSELVRLSAGGQPLELKSGYAMPHGVDWDGDGRLDILVGTESGAVYGLRRTGDAAALAFEAPAQILPPSRGKRDQPGERVQVSTADVDGDGLLDLLVGDYRSIRENGTRQVHGEVWWLRRLPEE